MQQQESPRLPLVVACVVNWNTPELTLACLRALSAQTYARLRIVVVDNDSRDDSIARIRSALPDTTVLHSDENIGFAAGAALALAQSRQWQAQAMWLVNSDAIVEPDALEHLVSAWRKYGDALFGGLPLRHRDDGRVELDFPAKFLAPDYLPSAFQRDREQAFDDDWRSRGPRRVGALCGSTLLVPLDVVEAHGWMDASWFMYCEETDYCCRLRRAGVGCYLVPAARAVHAGGGSQQGRSAVTDVVAYYRARNEILLARRHAGTPTAALIAAKKLLRALSSAVVNPRRGHYILRGAWDGIRNVAGKRHAPENPVC